MDALQTLLDQREISKKIGFDPLDRRIRCYAHIINICTSHVIASATSTSKSYLANLKVPVDLDDVACGDSNDASDDSASDVGLDDDADDHYHDVNEIQLADSFKNRGDSTLKEWFKGIQRNPLQRARNLVTFLRASDQRKDGLRDTINDGNKSNLFIGQDETGKHAVIPVPQLELLKDVKTRWDSVYLMLERLRHLRPVSLSQQSDVRDLLNL